MYLCIFDHSYSSLSFQDKLECQEKTIADQQTMILGFIEKENTIKEQTLKQQIVEREIAGKEKAMSNEGLKKEVTELFDVKVIFKIVIIQLSICC